MQPDRAYERVSIALSEDQVTFTFEDGASTSAPHDTVCESSVLRDVLFDTSDGQEGSIFVPRGILQAWIQSTRQEGPFHITFLQAADCLNDEARLKRLISQAACWLLEPSSPSGTTVTIHDDRAKAVADLPMGLATAILAEWPQLLHNQLAVLPTCLHMAAVQAAFPGIASDSALKMSASRHKGAVCQLAPLLPQLSHVTLLDMCGAGFGHGGVHAFFAHLSSLTNLQKMDLSDNLIKDNGCQLLDDCLGHLGKLQHVSLSKIHMTSEGLKSMAPQLAGLSSLQHLDVSCNTLCKQTAQPLKHCLDGLKHLRSLNLRDISMTALMAEDLAPSIGSLTMLTHLDLSLNKIEDRGADAMFSELQHLAELQELLVASCAISSMGVRALTRCLTSCEHLRKICLAGNRLRPEDMQVFAPWLSSMTCLEDLDISSIWTASEAMPLLASHLSKVTTLQTLKLSMSLLDDQGATVVAAVLQKFTGLQHLRLEGLRGDGKSILTSSLSHLKGLRTLWLKKLRSQEDIKAFGESLYHLERLQELHLSVHRFSLEGIEAVAQAFKSLSVLTLLKLGACNIDLAQAEMLATHLPALERLQHLNLRKTMENEALATIMPSIGALTALTLLDLSKNSLRAKATESLTAHLTKLTALKILYLSFSMFRGGVEALAPTIAKLSQLNHLRLNANEMFSQGATALTLHLTALTALESLELCANMFWDQGIQALAPLISSLSSLQHLDLAQNGFSVAGLQHLVPHISNLISLSLDKNRIGDAGVAELMEGIENSVRLERLEMSYCNVGDEGACILAEKLRSGYPFSARLFGNNITAQGAAALAPYREHEVELYESL